MEQVVETKHRHWRHVFLDALAAHGIVTLAAQAAGIERATAYFLRQQDPTFAEEWKAALDLGVDMLEDVAKKRAYEGSDTLLIFLLKAHRPERYREVTKSVQVNVTPEQVEQMSDDELDRLINNLRTGAR
jgi:hypothetical protein